MKNKKIVLDIQAVSRLEQAIAASLAIHPDLAQACLGQFVQRVLDKLALDQALLKQLLGPASETPRDETS